jgi:glutamate carboxypeptidase
MNTREKLKHLTECNSHTKNIDGVNKIGEIIAEWLAFMPRKIFKGKNLGDLNYFTSPSEGDMPRILLCGHADTVHSPDLHLPVRFEGEKMYGPGVSDMKGGLVVIAETLLALHRENSLTNTDFLLVPDEELGSLEHKRIMEKIYKQYEYALVYEGSGLGGAPDRRTVVIERKGAGAARFTVSAPGGHSGVLINKEDRISAIEEAALKVTAIFESADHTKGTTTNVGKISGGTAVNAIAESCILEADYRTKTTEERKRVRGEYEKLAKTDFIKGTKTFLAWLYDMPPMQQSEMRKEFAKLVRDTGKTVGLEIEFEKRGGGSDANRISRYVEKVLDGFGPQGGGDHTAGEFIYTGSLEPSILLSVEVLKTIIR